MGLMYGVSILSNGMLYTLGRMVPNFTTLFESCVFLKYFFYSSMLWQLVWVTETMESKIIHECVDHVLCCSKEITRLNPKSRIREYILPSLKGVLSNALARVRVSQEEDGIAVS